MDNRNLIFKLSGYFQDLIWVLDYTIIVYDGGWKQLFTMYLIYAVNWEKSKTDLAGEGSKPNQNDGVFSLNI